jgi:flagellar biosynthetic protein FliS
MRAGIAAYKATKVESANNTQIVLMLYQEIVSRLVRAEQMCTAGQPILTWLPHVHHARAVIIELQSALDDRTAPELCGRLRPLYRWCLQELVAVGSDGDVKHIVDVREVATTLLEAWQHVARSSAAA